jgi:hypothetical protein
VIVTVVGEPAPFHSSVAAEPVVCNPPNAKADACVPAPAKFDLAVDILAGDVDQLVQSYSSVAPEVPGSKSPPKATAAVCIPQPAKFNLAVFIELTVVQLFP